MLEVADSDLDLIATYLGEAFAEDLVAFNGRAALEGVHQIQTR